MKENAVIWTTLRMKIHRGRSVRFMTLDRHSMVSFKTRLKGQQLTNFLSEAEQPIIEFFNPALRSELEKNDTEIMKRTGLKGAAPRGDSWVWLTSYSRIPFEAIEGFCKKTKEYCPPGPTGSYVNFIIFISDFQFFTIPLHQINIFP